MKKFASLIVAASALCIAASAQAQNLYGEVAYQTLDSGLSTDPAIVRGTIGYELNQHIAFEGMFGFGATDGKETYLGTPVKLKIDNIWGIYAKPKLKLNDSFEIYARAGYANLKATASASAYGLTVSASDSGSDFSYGAGATYMVTPKIAISGDFMKYGDVDALAIGVGFKF